MAFKVASTNPRAGYDFAYEREALDPIGAEIVPVSRTTSEPTPRPWPTWTR